MEKLKHRVREFRVVKVPGVKGFCDDKIGREFTVPGSEPLFNAWCKEVCHLRSKGCPGMVKPPWCGTPECFGYDNGFHIERIK